MSSVCVCLCESVYLCSLEVFCVVAYIRVCVCVCVRAGLINSGVFEQPKSLNLLVSSQRKLTFPECCCWKPPWESSTVYNPNPKKSSKGVEIISSDRILSLCRILSLKFYLRRSERSTDLFSGDVKQQRSDFLPLVEMKRNGDISKSGLFYLC